MQSQHGGCTADFGTMNLAAAHLPPRLIRLHETAEARWAPGRRVGRYLVLKMLGAGTFGFTVLARRGGPRGTRFTKLVALKILKPAFAQDQEFCLRMRDEAKLQAELKHDQLVDVYDFHELGEELVLEMEYVDGMPLRDYLASFGSCPLPPFAVGYMGTRILRGLAWMHAARDEAQLPLDLVHRDIKPSNIFLSKTGALKIGDFGLVCGRGRQFDTAVSTDPRIVGTPRYMAPEQCDTGPVDGRTDVYSVGVMLYEMLTGGKHPANHHALPGELEALAATLRPERTPITKHLPNLPCPLGRLVDAMVAFHSTQRPHAADALPALLEACPFDGAREELAFQQTVRRVLQTHTAGRGSARHSAADEPTECYASLDLAARMVESGNRTPPRSTPSTDPTRTLRRAKRESLVPHEPKLPWATAISVRALAAIRACLRA